MFGRAERLGARFVSLSWTLLEMFRGYAAFLSIFSISQRHISRNIEAIDIFEGVWEGRTTWSMFVSLSWTLLEMCRGYETFPPIVQGSMKVTVCSSIGKETQIVEGIWPNLFVRSM